MSQPLNKIINRIAWVAVTLTVVLSLGALAYLKITSWRKDSQLSSRSFAQKMEAASQIKEAYQLEKTALKIPAQDKNGTEITIGDPKAKNFLPQLTLRKWGGEVSFKLKYSENSIETPKKEAAPDLNLEENKIGYSDGTSDVHFYEKPKSEEHPDGAYELEFILKEKPGSPNPAELSGLIIS